MESIDCVLNSGLTTQRGCRVGPLVRVFHWSLVASFTLVYLSGEGELLDLHEECRNDADSLRVMEAYLDRRLNVDWRTARQPPPCN